MCPTGLRAKLEDWHGWVDKSKRIGSLVLRGMALVPYNVRYLNEQGAWLKCTLCEQKIASGRAAAIASANAVCLAPSSVIWISGI